MSETAPDAWARAYRAIDAEVCAAIRDAGQRVRVRYSAYRSDANDIPRNNLKRVAARGRVIITSQRSQFYGGEHSKNYQSDVVENPTWLDVALLANEAIGVTRDRTHCFLEGLKRMDDPHNPRDDDVKVYRLVMGS